MDRDKKASFSFGVHNASPDMSIRRSTRLRSIPMDGSTPGTSGTIDAAGNVRITGRLKDIIIRNAENISAVEVEEMLYRHSAVAEAAVLGLPDTRTGERVVAVVVPRTGCKVELSDIRDHCRLEGLAIQKCPEQLAVVDALPRNAMGKVLKQDLRLALT